MYTVRITDFSFVSIKQANLHVHHRSILYVISSESYISEEKKDISVRCVPPPEPQGLVKSFPHLSRLVPKCVET